MENLEAVLRVKSLIEALAWMGLAFVTVGAASGVTTLLLRAKRLHFNRGLRPGPIAAAPAGEPYVHATRAYGRQVRNQSPRPQYATPVRRTSQRRRGAHHATFRSAK